MKKLWAILPALACVLGLCACSGDVEENFEMYIEPAQLTAEEQNIAELLGMNLDQRIFDFKVGETVQRVELNAYELIEGEWQMISGGGGQAFTDTEGRIALEFDHLGEGLREAIQSENVSGSTAWKRDAIEEPAGTSRATSLLTQRKQIVYEEEIPLAVQIVTTKNAIRSFDPSYYFHPEEYAEYGYEHVYAVTVRFSQEPLS